MTEATEDSSSSDDGREPIMLPEWLPPAAVVQARAIEARSLPAEQRAILQRLATDTRMRKVWTELTRRERPSGGFLHPAKQPPDRPAVTQKEAQAWALGELFSSVFHAGSLRLKVSKLDDVAPVKAKFLERVRMLREIADELTAANPGKPDISLEVVSLRRVARRYDNAASALRQPGDPLVIKNDRGDRVVRGVQIFCGLQLIEIFGERLDRTAATLAAVALGTPTSARVTRSAFSHRKGG